MLFGLRDRDAELFALAEPHPVDDAALDERCHDGTTCDGQVHEADDKVAEAVDGGELRRHSGEDGVEAGVDERGVEEDKETFDFESDDDCSQGVGEANWAALLGEGIAFGVLLCRIALLLEVGHEGFVVERRGDRAVADNETTCFRHEEEHGDEEDDGEDSEEPEDPVPARILGDDSAKDGAQGGSEDRC